VDCLHRLVGTEGEIEVNRQWGEPYPPLRMRQAGDDEWRAIEYDEPETNEVNRAIEHAMTALEADSEPAIGASNALRATQLIFGVYESARRRGRVEFPLDIEDHPLEAMVEAGDLRPVSTDD
jgi:predicted dehydrogenase